MRQTLPAATINIGHREKFRYEKTGSDRFCHRYAVHGLPQSDARRHSALCPQAKGACPAENFLLLPPGIANACDMRESLCYTRFGSYREFRNEIFALLDARLPQLPTTPHVFITAYNLTESTAADKNADTLCRAVKEYYRTRGLGKIFTVVLISRLHNYKYVDLINVPKHLLTFYSRIRLLQNKKLRRKTLITIGTIHKFTMAGVRAHRRQRNRL